jgi:predicted phosphodiesterase
MVQEEERVLSLTVPYSFLVITDTHITEFDTNSFENIENIVKQHGDSFVVVTGDVTQSGKKEELQHFIDLAGNLSVPCYPVLGNHDLRTLFAWRKMVGLYFYRIDVDAATLLFIDSESRFDEKNIDWLEEQMKTSAKNTFVFAHNKSFVTEDQNNHVQSMLEDNCTALFSGHTHIRAIQNIGGVEYITIEDFRDNGIYCRVYVTENGMEYEFDSVR